MPGGRGDERNGRGVGGAGGFTEVLIPVSSLTSTSLVVTVGQGGDSSTGSRTYGNGGAGDTDGSRNFGSGGGMSALTYRTLSVPGDVVKADLIAIAGGGGTSPAFTNPGSHAGEGGGLSGGDADSGGASINGLGGDQSSGGGSPPNGNPGGFLLGGDAVLNGGAGGGGYYGGGSGTIASNSEGSGGGGSGYISVTSTIDGQTIRGTIQTPPRTTDPDYVAGVGAGGNSNAGDGGNGLVVIEALFLNCDTDGDGILNYLDTDSDNDGIYDVLEAAPTFDGTITTEGRIDITANGVTDGVPNDADAGNGFVPLDTGSDGTLNFLNLDSDNDGCSDANEYYFSIDADGNLEGGDDLAYGDSSTLTVDADGLVEQATYDGANYANAIDNTIAEACNACNATATGETDTDGDGVIDSCDLDDDNDGILDMDELVNTARSGVAVQSSTGFSGVASRGIDGNTDGIFGNNSITHTNNTTPTEYWEVDLGSLNFIPTILFYNRTDCCPGRISNVYLLVADTTFPADATDLAGSLANADFTYQFATGESAASVNIPVNQSGR